ncbi:3-hydroxyacyl-CoA dehydrogenase family protein [Nocardia jiangxiensis]|uniref:3-hydroxyacyl-CoA dehydrogenase family protein n=1 Tax=Nocardia jiangxiensis TaxID=282685 RepID=UPI000593C319|nr:3-hydroxyacyl-CoA dehydrogenase NAD-binding domain-containing protein [Nocardia jiangxiensis]
MAHLHQSARVAVVGAGIMGSGIAQLAATAGYEVAMADADADQLARARAHIYDSVEKLAAKGLVDADAGARALRRLRPHTSVCDAAKDADVVIEAVVERLPVKQAVLAEAASVAAPNALLATNTSQLSVTAIASALPDAVDRVVGVHFFNPAVLMRLVEIVAGLETSAATVTAAAAFAESLGKETVICRKDSPGFLTSRIAAIVRLECLRMLEEGVGTAEDIDRALRLGLNFPIGPLELGDRNGHDTFLLAVESMAQTLGERFRPTVGLRNLVAAGRLGSKTGRGIYRYDEDGRIIRADSLG